MATYTRRSRQEYPATDPARRGAIDVAYVYVDEHFQSYMVKVPLEDDTPERIQEELRKKVAAAAAAGPVTIEF